MVAGDLFSTPYNSGHQLLLYTMFEPKLTFSFQENTAFNSDNPKSKTSL